MLQHIINYQCRIDINDFDRVGHVPHLFHYAMFLPKYIEKQLALLMLLLWVAYRVP